MKPDKYQQAWQAHSPGTRVTVDADLLLKEVQRNQRQFRATIVCRDFREVVVSLLLIPVWIFLGVWTSSPWTWYLEVPALIWVIGFFLVDRMRQKQKCIGLGETLLESVQESLAQVEHQIWLLRNVFWWYLLPLLIPVLLFFAHVAIQGISQTAMNWWGAVAYTFVMAPVSLEVIAIFYFLDYINQRAVRLSLGPRREELLALLVSLSGDDSKEEHATMHRAKSVEGSSVHKRWLITAVLSLTALLSLVTYVVIVLALASGITKSSYDGRPRSSGPAGASLATLITEQRKEKNLVGLAAMVTVDGQVEAAAAHGERKNRSGVPLEIGDRWHLGGITKSITATMIARLIEAGQMQWTDTVGEIFPETSVHADWKPVTLRQLLTDTAGAPVNFSMEVSRNRPLLGSESTQARREAVLGVIADRPAYPPGGRSVYSNVGYTIAGAMAEKVTGVNWEDLVKREVFELLELTEAGFGPPKSADKTLEQPRGHRPRFAGKVPVDDDADNTSIMGPSGIVHMSLRDLCTFAGEHLRGEQGIGTLLSAETYKLLHTPDLRDYACGWGVKEPNSVIPHTVYWHNGSNTMWYALVVFIPEKNMVVAVTSNDGDSEQAEAAAWEIVNASANQFNVEGDALP
jgi:CubicO group peptidase (beta-lactamase class C family)